MIPHNVGMHEHVGHMHDMQMICMNETCGPPRHADPPDMRYQLQYFLFRVLIIGKLKNQNR